jgi:hypothetical protein
MRVRKETLCGIEPKPVAIRFNKGINRGDVEESGMTLSVAIDSHPGKTFPKPISRKFGPAISKVKCVNLALQGGSAHGAFTWGVLDRLLEEPRIEVEGISATSAGAMNAAVMAHGLTTGGRQGAREALEGFWHGVARLSAPLGALQ